MTDEQFGRIIAPMTGGLALGSFVPSLHPEVFGLLGALVGAVFGLIRNRQLDRRPPSR